MSINPIPTITDIVIGALDDVVGSQGSGLTLAVQPLGKVSNPTRYDLLVLDEWKVLVHGEIDFDQRYCFFVNIKPIEGADAHKLATKVNLIAEGAMESYLQDFEELVSIANKNR